MNPRLIALAPILACPTLALAGPFYSTDFEHANYDAAAVWSSSDRVVLGGPYTDVLGRFSNKTVNFTLHATQSNTAGLVSDTGGGGPGAESAFNIEIREINAPRTPIPLPDTIGGYGSGKPYTGPFLPPTGYKFNLGGALFDGVRDPEPPSTDPMFVAGQYALTFDLMLFDSWDGNYEHGPDAFSVSVNGQKLFDELLQTHDPENNFRLPDEIPTQNAFNERWKDLIYRDITINFELTEALDQLDIQFVGTLNQAINDESWGLDNVRLEQVVQLRGASLEVPAPGTLALLGSGMGLMTRRRR